MSECVCWRCDPAPFWRLLFILYPQSTVHPDSHLWIGCASFCQHTYSNCFTHIRVHIICTSFIFFFIYLTWFFFFCLGGQKRACDCQGLHVCLSGCWKWLCSTALLVLFVYKVIAKKSPSLLVTVPRVCGPGCHFKCHEHSLGSWTWSELERTAWNCMHGRLLGWVTSQLVKEAIQGTCFLRQDARVSLGSGKRKKNARTHTHTLL